jgi:hydroxymethylglutaryl-CoA synthase
VGQLLAYGAYVPRYRLSQGAIAAALQTGGGRGWRAVASFDEDSTSMAVEAARQALRRTDVRPLAVYLATTSPAYLDKTNAFVVNAALGLDPAALAMDVAAAVRGGGGALIAAHDAPRPTLAVLSDLRGGLPGSADERDGADAAAAFLFGPGPGIAEVVAVSSASEEFLDRWRLPGEPSSRVWEDRFGESVYLPLAQAALTDALKQAGVSLPDVRHAVVTGTNRRAVARFAREAGFAEVTTDATLGIGHAGTAQVGLLLADVLDRAGPDELVAVTLLADGATTVLLRTTPALIERRDAAPGATVRGQAAAGDDGLPYLTYLTWRGLLTREPPRRPDPDPPAAPPSYRNQTWKYHLVASRCDACGTRHLPPARSCVSCGQVDRMSAVPMADVRASVTTFAVDKLAYTPSPPLVAVVLDFDGGGRLRCQLADAAPGSVAVGDRVEMTFRRMTTARGIHNYFWKARPVPEAKRS